MVKKTNCGDVVCSLLVYQASCVNFVNELLIVLIRKSIVVKTCCSFLSLYHVWCVVC